MKIRLFLSVALIIFLISCTSSVNPTLAPPATLTPVVKEAEIFTTPSQASTQAPTLNNIQQIYQLGQTLGNNSRTFSKIGDCETGMSWFLTDFDGPPSGYSLGEYSDLSSVIDQFQGSFGRESLAAQNGFSTSSVLSSIWADPDLCHTGETPLACEVRIHRPSFALVMLGTNDVHVKSKFERNMRTILDFLVSQGVVPILVTKADNVEGDGTLNQTIVNLAQEYDIPLWDFWTVVQPLPEHGLQEDGIHLTWASNRFDNPDNLKFAWPWRNLSALQALNKVWNSVK